MNYEELMKSLQKKYLHSLPATIELIELQFKQNDWPAVELEFHKLRGNGTTYGFTEISTLAKVSERICQTSAASKEETIGKAIALLKAILESRLSGHIFDLENNQDFRSIDRQSQT
jgi:HPt (histidine-containing phosphotransfer) domain-containing protein